MYKFPLNADDDKQMDSFNEVNRTLRKELEIDQIADQVVITFAQAAEVLKVKEQSVVRYAYSNPAVLELGTITHRRRGVTLDSVVARLVMVTK